MSRSRKNNGRFVFGIAAAMLIIGIVVIAAYWGGGDAGETGKERLPGQAESVPSNRLIAEFARQHGLQNSDWPDELIELLDKNPDTEEYVLNYPLKKDRSFPIDLEEYRGCSSVPLFFQWDERWGYTTYGDGLMGLTGCGPTCLSMVCIYLLQDTKYDPRYIADFAEKEGYYAQGVGSAWTLISQGGNDLGLNVTEIPLVENKIIESLKAGKPVICAMGPGAFTTTGHFIVMTQYVDGKIRVNDPNSKTRSEKLWEYSDVESQIRNLWVCSR